MDLHFEVVRLTCGEGQIEEAGGEVDGPRGRATMVASFRERGGPGEGEWGQI